MSQVQTSAGGGYMYSNLLDCTGKAQKAILPVVVAPHLINKLKTWKL